jgi:vitamin B12 transporter
MGLRSEAGSAWNWRLMWFDNRIEDLITYTYPTMANVNRARIHGLEGAVEVTLWGVRMKASAVGQRPRDEDTGYMLQGRAQYFGRIEAMKAFGEWSLSGGASASSERFDSTNESPQSRLPGYAIADAALRYAPGGGWTMALTASNLFDKRYEQSVGYDAPGRSILLSARFEGF